MTSARASLRLERARLFLQGCDRTKPLLIVAASSEAGSELVRSLGKPVFGWRRLTLFRAAADLARPALLAQGRALAGNLTIEALWERVVFELAEQRKLGRFASLAGRPGLSKALARSVNEARNLGLSPSQLEPALGSAMIAFEAALDERHLADRALVFQLALDGAKEPQPLVLLDVAPDDGLEHGFLEALVTGASSVCVTMPSADEGALARVEHALGNRAEVLTGADANSTPLEALQQNLFTSREALGSHTFSDVFSAPGEARECVEIARRVLEAAALTPFDQIAVLLRSPSTYRAPLEDAFRRAKIPAYFASGIPAPDPSGRALLALLRCAEEGLSARRFSEYLSLGQVPAADGAGAPPAAKSAAERFERATADTLLPVDDKAPLTADPLEADEATDPDAPVSAGRLRSPRKWERLIIDAAVIGGVDRWKRRLEGLEQGKRQALKSPTMTEAQQQRVERELADLGALSNFALPLLQTLANFPRAQTWGDWQDQLSALATRALKYPQRVLSVLSELSPMEKVGPIELREVRAVLTDRLSEVTEAPGVRRYGQVFVAPVEQARGLSFELVFVPGLAERIFPQKVREDPLLPDAVRAAIDPRLETNAARIARERIALRLAVGAANTRAVLSWPRIDAEHSRPRVPSFYALEAARAIEGSLPAYEVLQRRAEQSGQARLAWPAPQLASTAIDDTEYDLAILDEILSASAEVKGRARYLVEVSPHLGRALRARYARWTQSSWTFADGLVRPDAQARAGLESHQLTARPFSPTALEQFAACPYKFFLSAVHRLSPLEIPGEIEELGPLEKGSMTHKVQYTLLTELRSESVRVTEATLELVFKRLDDVIATVTAEFADDFVPAIERVWNDGIEVMRADLREWLRKVAADTDWEPWRFELSFGLGERQDQDPSSVPKPVQLTQGVQLRGSIDLVERSSSGHLRATDYKTGRARASEGNVVGGGRHLQPVLYALVLEKLFPEATVDGGQLFYCTQVGGFAKVPTPLDNLAREHMGRVMLAIRAALEQGFFPAMPEENECRWCDFRPVCGPEEERRIRLTKKGLRAETRELVALRDLP